MQLFFEALKFHPAISFLTASIISVYYGIIPSSVIKDSVYCIVNSLFAIIVVSFGAANEMPMSRAVRTSWPSIGHGFDIRTRLGKRHSDDRARPAARPFFRFRRWQARAPHTRRNLSRASGRKRSGCRRAADARERRSAILCRSSPRRCCVTWSPTPPSRNSLR